MTETTLHQHTPILLSAVIESQFNPAINGALVMIMVCFLGSMARTNSKINQKQGIPQSNMFMSGYASMVHRIATLHAHGKEIERSFVSFDNLLQLNQWKVG